MPESSARESTRRARSITDRPPSCRSGKPRRGLRERRLQRLLRRGGRDPRFFLGRCVEVVQQINLTRVDQRFAVKAQLFDVGGFLQESSFVVSVRNRRYRTPEYPQSARPAKWSSEQQQFSSLPGSVLYAGCAHSLLHRGRYRSNARKRERFPLRG